MPTVQQAERREKPFDAHSSVGQEQRDYSVCEEDESCAFAAGDIRVIRKVKEKYL